ncbi:hypothetical protein OROGR_018177 [Orobanche gracilis]
MNSKVVSINLYAIFMLFLVVFLRETEVSTACNLSSVITSCLPSLHGIFTKPAGVKECCPILWKENLDYCLCDDLKSLKMAGIKNMWGKAVLTVNYILNKIPRKGKNVTPYELWKGRKPSYKYLKVWGCLAKVEMPLPKQVKIGPKTVDCIFIGYAINSSAYRFIIHKSKVPEMNVGTTIESMNAVFFENIYPCKNNDKVDNNSGNRIEDEATSSKSTDVDPKSHKRSRSNLEDIEPRRGSRVRTPKTFGPDYVAFMLDEEPTSIKVAYARPDGLFWKEAVQSEIDSILQNQTWVLVDLPEVCKPLGCKWILKRKYKEDGSIDKYKARLVVKGFKQKEGYDFFDTYSPVTRITSIRVLLAIAALHNLEIHQMDVKTAFLNGDLDEEIYMKQPEG